MSYTEPMQVSLDVPPLETDAAALGLGYDMQFADPEYETPLNRECLQNAEYRQDMRYTAWGSYVSPYGTGSYPPCYTVYDSESSTWVHVSFKCAWLFYALYTCMVELIVWGIAVNARPGLLSAVVLAVLGLIALPGISYTWTRHARYKHYGRNV